METTPDAFRSPTPRLPSPIDLPQKYVLAGAALIVVLTAAIYAPALQGQFVLDDDGLITQSKLIHDSRGLYRIWFTAAAPEYYPVSYTTFWLDWRLWGLQPFGYHLTNLLLHMGSSLLLWGILRRLAIPGAFLAALLFAVHPVNVESVAWIAQRRNVLSMFFFLLSILWYLHSEEPEANGGMRTGEKGNTSSERWYWLSLLAFLLAMLSKGSVAILPVVLLGLAWWRRGSISREDWSRTGRFFIVAIVLTGINIWFQKHGTDVVFREATFAQRLAGAGAVIWFYLLKALLPVHLVFVYPQWDIQTADWRWWLPLAAAILVSAVLWRQRDSQWGRPLLFGWALYCLAILPVMGFTDVGFMQYSLVADHYQYIALIAVVTLAAAGWSVVYRLTREALRWAPMVFAAAAVAALAVLSFQQAELYAGPIELYSATIRDNPDGWMAQYNLANSLMGAKQFEDAIEHYQRTLQLKPEYPEALTNLGMAYNATGQKQKGIESLQYALRAKPDFVPALSNLGVAFMTAGRTEEGLANLLEAVRVDPNSLETQGNAGAALLESGQPAAAREHFARMVELAPNLAEGHNSLGMALLSLGELEEATAQFRQALALKPNFAPALNNLGLAMFQADQPFDAIEQYQQALSISPNYADAETNLGNALVKTGQADVAVEHFRHSLKLKPSAAKTWLDFAKALAVLRHPDDATAAAEKAIALAREHNQLPLASQAEEWLTAYRAAQQKSESETRKKESPVKP